MRFCNKPLSGTSFLKQLRMHFGMVARIGKGKTSGKKPIKDRFDETIYVQPISIMQLFCIFTRRVPGQKEHFIRFEC